MPLLKKTFYPLEPLAPADLSSEEEVYVVRVTKEAVRSYDEYLEKLKAYRTRQWTCKYSGKTGMTYEEALASESSHSKAFWEKFADGWDEKVLQLVHHSTLTLDLLVNHVYDSLRPAPKSTGKENGEADAKTKLPFTKNQLRTFIHERAEHRADAAWFVPQEVAQKLGLSSQVPEAVHLAMKKAAKKKQKLSGESTTPAPAAALKLPSKSASKANGTSGEAEAEKAADKREVKSASKVEGTKPGSKLTKLSLAHATKGLAAKTSRQLGDEVDENEAAVNGEDGLAQIEEAEKNMRPGTLRHAAFMVLKEAAPKGLSVNEIIAIATERELRTDWSSKTAKKSLFQVLRDPLFVRVGKGRYSLAGYPGVVPYVPEEKGEGDGEEADEEGGEAPSGEKKEKKKMKKQGEDEDGDVEMRESGQDGQGGNGLDGPARMEEAEKNMRQGTCKYAAFMVLKEVAPKGLSTAEIISKATERELKTDWSSKNANNMLHHVLRDPVFVRVGKGRYSLAGYPGVVPYGAEEQEEGEKQGDKDEDEGREAAGDGTLANGFNEDAEKSMRPGSCRHAAFMVLKEVAPKGLSLDEIIAMATVRELRTDWSSKTARKSLYQVLRDPVFVRVGKGRYSLAGYPGVVPYVPEEKGEGDGELADEEGGEAPSGEKKEKKRKKQGEEEEGNNEVRESGEAPKGRSKGEKKPKKQGDNGAAGSAADGAVAATAADAEPEVVSLGSLEQAAKKHAALVEQLRGRLDAADEQVTTLTKKVLEAEESLAKWQATRRQQADAEEMPSFELPEELQEYKGDPDDRKALMAFKRQVELEKAKLEEQRKEWLRESKAKKDKARQALQKFVEADKKALKKAQALMDTLKKEMAAAVKQSAEVERVFEREKSKVALREAKEKDKLEREAAREREREERERRRLEALEAKRWPIEDLELLREMQHRAAARGEPAPPEDIPLPCDWLEGTEAHTCADHMYVLDFLQQFQKTLKLPLTNAELDTVMTQPGHGKDMTREQLSSLREIHTRLLEVLLEDLEEGDVADRTEQRWKGALSKATVMEVLKWYIRSREDGSESTRSQLVSPDVKEVATFIAQGKEFELSFLQHLTLLRFLCDEVLDTELVRGSIQGRIEQAADVGADMRAELAEERKKLRDLLDAQKEERKRKREEAQAAALAAATQLAAAAAENGGTEHAQALKKARSVPQSDSNEFVEEPEPSWELPEELREYNGDPNDRSAMIQFRQKQQDERKRLEKSRDRWHDRQRKLRKEWEAQQRAQREVERKKQLEIEKAEEAVMKVQEAYEKEMEKYIIRRVPVGLDRQYRRYWWGVAGVKDTLWVEESTQRWGSITNVAEVDALVTALDNRGIRERDLKSNLEKCQTSIINAMKRATQARDKVAKAEASKRSRQEEGKIKRTSSRLQTVEAEKTKKPEKEEEEEEEVSPEDEAAEEVGDHLDTLGSWALAAKITAPKGGWKAWRSRCKDIAAGELEEEDDKDGDKTENKDDKDEGKEQPGKHDKVMAALKQKLLDVEELLYESTGERRKHEGDGEDAGDGEEKKADSDAKAEPMEVDGVGDGDDDDDDNRSQRVKRRLSHGHSHHDLEANQEYVEEESELNPKACIWLSKRERSSWRSCVEAAGGFGSLAYWAAVLAHHAEEPMAKVAKSKGGASSKKRSR